MRQDEGPNGGIAALSSKKRELLRRLLARTSDAASLDSPLSRLDNRPPGSAPGNAPSPIPVIPRETPLSLSYAQQRLWFIHRLLHPRTSTFNLPLIVQLKGSINRAILEQSFREVVRRHESLRTTFAEVDGQPVQIVAAEGSVAIRWVNLRDVADSEREAEAWRQIDEETVRTFDLEHGPLLRVTMFELNQDEYLQVFVMHHIIGDGWSYSILLRDVAGLYFALLHGKTEPPLPKLSIQFADYAHWQRNLKGEEYLAAGLDYWKRKLDGLKQVLELPTDHPRPANFSHRGGSESVMFPPALVKALRRLAENHNVTLFTILLAAFQVLLMRYTGEEDFAIGTPVAERDRAETADLIGIFVNTLVLRADLSSDPTFINLLQRVQAVLIEAQAHQSVPFERVVEEARPLRDTSRSPLIQTVLSMENARHRTPAYLAGIPFLREPRVTTAKVDLTLSFLDATEALRARIIYCSDLFEASTAVRMLGHFQMLLDGIVEDPDRPISQLPYLTPTENRRLFAESNGAENICPASCLHRLFETQVQRTPESVAVIATGVELSYAELNRRANRLARQLREMGVGPDVLVGLCVEPSVEMVVGVLGILKAGGAYIPLDPASPTERRLFMLRDANVRVLLTHRRLLPDLAIETVSTVHLDAVDLVHCDSKDDENPDGEPSPSSLAYVLYTSGSTGEPKGVMVEHGSVVNYLFGLRDLIRAQPDWNYAMVQPLTVDSSVSTLYPPLLFGGVLHIISKDTALNPRALEDYFARHPIDMLKIAPSHLAALLDGRDGGQLLPRRCLIIGGESSRSAWAEKLQSASPACAIFNHYGPTEATVGVTTYRVTGSNGGSAMLPIGRPLPNVRTLVLDGKGQLVPVGVFGELYCGGSCLARGYLNLPRETDDRFIKDPFDSSPSARLYRTGDLVRWLPDGNLEFARRIDQQVKIRGYRVELGEIEAALATHPEIEEAVVALRRENSGQERLIAYVVSRDGQPVKTVELKRFLDAKLPGYMIPTAFVTLSDLPRTPHGKLDRRALPEPPHDQAESAFPITAARDELEIRLSKIWERTLGIAPVGLRDNFFDLGGHSLMAVALFNRVEEEFGRRLPLATLFASPTVEQMAATLRDGAYRKLWVSLVPLQPQGDRMPFFCVHANGGNVLLYRQFAERMAPNYPVYGLQSAGLDGSEPMLTSVKEMAARYIREIQTVQPEGPYCLGGFCMGAYIAHEMACQLQEQGQEIGLLAAINTDGVWKTAGSFAGSLRLHADHLSRLDFPGKAAYITERAAYRMLRAALGLWRRASGMRQGTSRPLSSRLALLRLFETNSQASTRHQPSKYDGRLIYFQGNEDAGVNPGVFWNQVVSGGIDVQEVPGKNISVLEPPNVEMLARKIQACLDHVRSPRNENSR